MATQARSRPRAGAAANGAGPLDKAKDAAGAVRGAGRPALAAASAAAAGLAGGVLIGSRVHGRRRPAAAAVAWAGAKRLGKTAAKASRALDDVHAIRTELEHANRRSPIEVVLQGLTRRPGTGRGGGA
jgi:hypothetical protein